MPRRRISCRRYKSKTGKIRCRRVSGRRRSSKRKRRSSRRRRSSTKRRRPTCLIRYNKILKQISCRFPNKTIRQRRSMAKKSYKKQYGKKR